MEVYIVKSLHGHVIAFARCGNEVRIFNPDNMWQKEMKITIDEWMEIKKSYDESSDVGNYIDVVNAAWQRLGITNPINKGNVRPLNVELGTYFPRIWRGVYDPGSYYRYNNVDARKTYGSVYIGANVAASSIFDAVEELFLYVEPSKENLSTFSHKIREALILSCTEVESAWRSVLEANSAKRKDSYATSDYIRLVEPLQLTKWAVSLRDYPDLGSFAPFSSWNKLNPTKSLPWYDAYNAVKHHREEKFKQASLDNLIKSAAALHVMMSAQWGPDIFDRWFGNEKSPFFTTSYPSHDLSDIYIPDFLGGKRMSPKAYFN